MRFSRYNSLYRKEEEFWYIESTNGFNIEIYNHLIIYGYYVNWPRNRAYKFKLIVDMVE